ncbi:MAG: diadenosine tetraphosphatase ApaH/serine/threonine PP2A family protein phosphatase [Myxococcota bacterium]|jgi:diadenosine tetraphosphatase ApaH/serine/threonine PP2A family protein phosphatase
MRYGIISDTHGNLEGLTASLEALDRAGVDRIACLGDTVGYGAQPNECCDIIRELAYVTVLGNHDAVVADRLDPGHCHAAARRALFYSREHLSEENLQWLKDLPYNVDDGAITWCHGSPIDVEKFEYVFSLDKAAALTGHFEKLNHVTFVGHSHLTTAYLVTERMSLQVAAPRFRLREGVKYVFNVGSVGQPRDRDNRACCVVYDTDEQIVTYIRVPYDVDTAASKIFDAELPAAFGQRLYHGV